MPSTPKSTQNLSDATSHSTPLPQSQLLFSQENGHNASSECGESVVVDESEQFFANVDKMYEEIENITQNGIETGDEPESAHAHRATETLKTSVKKLEYLVYKSIEVVASKDHQICVLQESVETLQGSVTSLVSTCGQIIEKYSAFCLRYLNDRCILNLVNI